MNHRAQRLGLFSAVGETCSPLMPRRGHGRQSPLRCQPSWTSGVYNHENPQSCLHPHVLGGSIIRNSGRCLLPSSQRRPLSPNTPATWLQGSECRQCWDAGKLHVGDYPALFRESWMTTLHRPAKPIDSVSRDTLSSHSLPSRSPRKT